MLRRAADVIMGAAQIEVRQPEKYQVIATGGAQAQLLGVRGAPGNTVNHPVSILVPRHFAGSSSPRHVDLVWGWVTTGARASCAWVVTNLAVLDFKRGRGAAAVPVPGSPGR